VKQEKQLLLEEMKEQLRKSGSFVIAQYTNMTGDKAYEFRRALAQTGGYFEVVRKRMLIEAAKQIGIEFNAEELPGHIGLVLGASDTLEASKAVLKFSTANSDSLTLIAGYLDGQKASRDDVQRLATLPGKDQMRAELLGLFVAPMTGVLGVMNAVMSDVVSCIDSKASAG
jgi:large subunit ribosomal protein L10